MRDLVIVGSGGFARETEWLVERVNSICHQWNFMGFVSRETGNSVIGDDTFLTEYNRELDVVIAIGDCTVRKKLADQYRKNKKLHFPNIIDPDVRYSKSVHMGIGNILCAGSILTVDIEIGNFDIINLGCTVGHDAVISDYVTLNPNVNISGNVKVEALVNIGTGTQVVQGQKIGYGTVVGAGAVVNRTLPELCTAVGVPARPIKYFGGLK